MNNDIKAGNSENTATNAEIRFDPAKRDEKTNNDLKKIKKHKKVPWYFLIPGIIFTVMIVLLLGWQIKPKKAINIAVLDKTVLIASDDNDIEANAIYRKHQGFYWLLEQHKYVKPDGKYYKAESDYFGPMLNSEGQIDSERYLSELDFTPDLMYVSDVYGAVDDTYGYFNDSTARNPGITVDDMSVISYAYESNATVIAELGIFNSGSDDSVYSQLSSMCGVKPSGWAGRYIVDLQDFTDVPDWAPPMYEQQEGVEWQFSGPGVLLVSAEKIIVLEQKTDFESKNLLKVYIAPEFKKEFKHCGKTNFYNWFEIVEPMGDCEVLANFEFDVNATGMEKLKGVLKSPVFCAATRKKTEGKSPVYYFAGDFNDVVGRKKFNRYLFAESVYKSISFDRQGDTSNFFWSFYTPFMGKIMSEIEPKATLKGKGGKANSDSEKRNIRLNGNEFQIETDDKWKKLRMNTVSINGTEPGKNTLSRNYVYFEQLVEEAVNMGADCIYAKDILPPEFYRAVFSHNSGSDATPLYIIQNIAAPKAPTEADWLKKIESVLDALHGNGTIDFGEAEKSEAKYFIDVSDYVAAITFDGNTGGKLTYDGKYAEGKGTTGLCAFVYDRIQNYSKTTYKKSVPIGIGVDAGSVKGTGFDTENAFALDDVIKDDSCLEHYSFLSVSFDSVKNVISSNKDKFPNAANAYESAFTALNKSADSKLMIDGIGFSSTCGMESLAPMTEKYQGQQIVSVLRTANKVGALCAVASDLNDDWSAVSSEMYPFTTPIENNCMWQNVADPAQTTGFVALDPKMPENVGINMTDDDRVRMLSLSANEGYFYITAQLLYDIDYQTERLFIGIDTYQRNDGEYYYSKDYTPTSLSGMEYTIRFDGKQSAGIYVIAGYDRGKGQYVTKENYSGDYNLVSKLKYGGFSSGDNQFYQTGSTIYIRIPWTWLNVTDPSNKIVINNEGPIGKQTKTVSTNGAIVSVMIADKATKDQLYLFPETKQEPSYKTFKWSTWETVNYKMREKESYTLIKKYFSAIK